MAIIENSTGISDEAAIAELNAAFAAQKKAFAADRTPTAATRKARIQTVMEMVRAHRHPIHDALAADFGSHPKGASDLIEMLGVLGRAQYALDHLEEWMRPQPRHADPALMGQSEVYIQPQAKGVIGNIVPWNFPFDIALGPMIDMLGAGNRVMIKPSDYTPASAELLRTMIGEYFPADLAYVAVGGLELARAFSKLPLDHLLYTGSPNVGREIMAAAAPNLTPVTLELGGKCPTVMTAGSVTRENVGTVIGTKIIKNGQMCISVDHVYVPREDVADFTDHARAFMAEAAPDYAKTSECTGIISDRHLARLSGMLEEVGAVAPLIALEENAATDPETRRMPMHLVIDPPSDTAVMRDEIFGPIMPIIPYDRLEDVIDRINAGERPLAVYVFSEDEEQIARVLDQTTTGGAAVNLCAIQGGLPSLGFGGTGNSGMGRHHGEDGFREFSNPRGVVVKKGDVNLNLFWSPYDKAARLVEDTMSATVQG
ncbi:aldehyde dehydrogenase family protein [Sphingobium chlorophenolicum]|uniref:Aldehyde dehydrogenase n=1 Tax=Sphingobium chlorophenolicum TaxID=46429 RepID=A0A081RFC3_SPHCR|nr:aldehyde dehydrogenase family protein [Sphingobium chlorophenolicum]KEQ53896.1 Aldehyde dehydrogenase [Sphingobium chlorophenolicum]